MTAVNRSTLHTVWALVSALAWVLASAVPAAAAVDVDEIAEALRADGYYAEAGASIDRDAIDALGDSSTPIYLVVLAADPGEDPSLTAQRIAEQFGSGTFVVRIPGFLGVYSVDFDDAQVEAALDESWDAWSDSDADGITALERALTGKGGFPFGTVVFGGIAALIGWGIYRGRKSSKDAAERQVGERRTALGEQADDVANDILSLSDQVQAADNDEATAHYRSANSIFSETQDAIAKATTEMESAELSTQLTKAEWHLEAVEAILEGREVPTEPTDRPIECFFHQHKAGVERAEVQTPAGTQAVSVCRECAARLAKSEAPPTRDVVVGGTRVPRARAPRSYGGGGLDLDVFDVVVGSGRTSYDWSRSRPPRPASPRGVGRTRRIAGSSAPRRSSGGQKRGGGRASRRIGR